MTFIVDLAASFAGSMLALVVWFHFDLEGHWQHRKHARMIHRGEKKDTPS